ncbi:hypothetical protein ACX122_17445 [Kosakonia cowanii]
MTALIDMKKLASLFIIAMMLYVATSLSLRPSMDDQAFLHALDGKNYLSFMSHRYMTWSGRVVIDTLLIYTIKHDLFWRLMIPSSIFVLSLFTIKSIGLKSDPLNVSLAMSLILLMPNEVLRDSVWWVTGAYNYILPAACGVYCFWHYRHGSGRIYFALLLPAILIAFDNEQVGLVLLPALLATVLINRFRITKTQAFTIILSIAKYTSLIFAPGNAHRSMRETFNRMPEFSDLSMLNKLGMGLDRLHEMYTAGGSIILFALAATVFLCLRKSELCLKNKAICLLITMCYSVLLFISHLYNTGFLFLQKQMNYMPLNNYLILASYIIVSMYICTIVYAFIGSRDFISALSIVLGSGTVLAIGLSPTVYASGYRVLFVAYLLVVFAILGILKKIDNDRLSMISALSLMVVLSCVSVNS